MAGKLLYGYWDCKYCDTKKINGLKKNCPNCGKPQDEDTIFYMSNPTDYVPESIASKVSRKSDWVCNNCDQLNPDNLKNCKWCGSSRNEENKSYLEVFEKKGGKSFTTVKDTPFSSSSSLDAQHSEPQIKHSSSRSSTLHSLTKNKSTSNKKISFNPNIFKNALLILLVMTLIGGLVYLLIPKEYTVSVEGFSWARNINIEIYKTVQESDWTLPSNARLRYTRNEISHYEQVIDHYETKARTVTRQVLDGYETYVSGYNNLGNGLFEEVTSTRPIYRTEYETETYQEPVYRSEPVYKTKYYYDIDKWIYERTVSSSSENHEPYWGEYTLKANERVSSMQTSYIVYVLNNEKTVSYELSFDDWNTLKIGDIIKIKVSLGNVEILEKCN